MAAAAARGDIRRATGSFAVAIDTVKICVTSVQAKLRMNVVVERCYQPVVAVMTSTAGVAKRSFMRIVITVTVCAAAFRIVKLITGMASTASNGRMQPD